MLVRGLIYNPDYYRELTSNFGKPNETWWKTTQPDLKSRLKYIFTTTNGFEWKEYGFPQISSNFPPPCPMCSRNLDLSTWTEA